MGVTYKLKDEVVQFIISQRQGNPLSSCRQLAESASQKFGLQLSKSSVHDVLKESGIITPRGRKPKARFEIPKEKKKQIQTSLSQVKLLAAPVEVPVEAQPERQDTAVLLPDFQPEPPPDLPLALPENDKETGPGVTIEKSPKETQDSPQEEAIKISPEYEGAGRIFLKAVLWDLGIFPEKKEGLQQDQGGEQGQTHLPMLQEADWNYFLTYSKGLKVTLENNKDFFIDLPLPIERCIREVADGLINNVQPLIVHKVSDEALFKASMEAQAGFKINNISIVGQNDHILLEFRVIVELNRTFMLNNRIFVDSNEKDFLKRAKAVFFPEISGNNILIDNILNLRGFDSTNKSENIVSLLIENSYNNKAMIQDAAEKINGMYLRDEQDRLVKVKIQAIA